MSWFWTSKKIKKTRKPHTCEYCGLKIPIGSSCVSESGLYEGEYQYYYLCDRCKYYITEINESIEDELDDFWENLQYSGLLDCPKCGSSNHREYDWTEDKQKVNMECDNCDHVWEYDISLKALKTLKELEGG